MSDLISSKNNDFDLSLGLEGTHALISGGCGLIGRVIAQAFLAAGCKVTVTDIVDQDTASTVFDINDPNLCFAQADITNAEALDNTFTRAEHSFGSPVECCIALAGLDLSVLTQTKSICDMDPGEWRRVFDVNVNGSFLTCQRWLRGIRSAAQDADKARKLKNVGLVIMGSESGTFGVRTQAAYAAGKSAVQYGLLRSLAKDAPRIYAKARVNAVAPGAVDTERFRDECERYGEEFRYEECEATVGSAKAVPPEDVARVVLMLASERFGGSVHGQCVAVDGGKMGSLVWGKGELAERGK